MRCWDFSLELSMTAKCIGFRLTSECSIIIFSRKNYTAFVNTMFYAFASFGLKSSVEPCDHIPPPPPSCSKTKRSIGQIKRRKHLSWGSSCLHFTFSFFPFSQNVLLFSITQLYHKIFSINFSASVNLRPLLLHPLVFFTKMVTILLRETDATYNTFLAKCFS